MSAGGLNVVGELLTDVRAAFGWDADVVVSEGPRGALGQIWRLDVGPARYALKEIFGEPPSAAMIEAELAFAQRAAKAGVRLPAGHPDRDGRYLFATRDGRWLRLHDWVDLRPLDLTAHDTPHELGTLLARLHRSAPTSALEPGGAPPDPWYERVPATHEWTHAATSGTAWAARLADRLDTLPKLCAEVPPADPATLITCHRDLHPDNVLANHASELVVLDWDNNGPAVPDRELARAMFDWFCDGTTDLDAMRALYDTYLREGGPGRITNAADFTMLLASRLNFLLTQTNIALNPQTTQQHQEWAEREIDEALTILSTPQQLTAVLAALNSACPSAEG